MDKPLKILVLTDPYGKPSFAPRLRFFCEDWLRRGYRIRVITQSFEPIAFEHTYPIDCVSIYHGRLDWVIKSAWSLLTDWRNRYFSKRVIEMVEDESYDLVFCTTFSTFPLRAALDVARHKHIPLHVDLRDLDEQVPGAQYQYHRGAWTRLFRTWYKHVNIRRRNKVLREADSISTVSPWHVDWVKQFNSHVHLIYNGYDAQQFYFEAVHHPTFNISYIGKIYDFQHPTPLIQLIERLHSQYADIVLDWHTPDHQPIPLASVGDTYRRSSMAIVLTDSAAKGMMTTKFYEALGSEKPIICYPSDHGLLAETIHKTHAGIVSDDLDEIEQYILTTYQTWKKQGYTRQASQDIALFSRAYQAEQLDAILQATAHKKRPMVADICWTLYRSNTTFDFMDAIVHESGYLRLRRWMQKGWLRRINLGLLKLTRVDWFRAIALRYLYRHPQEEIQEQAELFVRTTLEKKRIEAAWKMLEGREVILVSGTIQPIADAVGRLVGAKKVYSGDIFKRRALHELGDYDIVTDNLSDEKLIRRAHHAYIVTYDNEQQWQRKRFNNITFITHESERY